MQARKEEREAVSARRTLESELEDAQVNTAVVFTPQERRRRSSMGQTWIDRHGSFPCREFPVVRTTLGFRPSV